LLKKGRIGHELFAVAGAMNLRLKGGARPTEWWRERERESTGELLEAHDD
jgi:hypothetical protein